MSSIRNVKLVILEQRITNLLRLFPLCHTPDTYVDVFLRSIKLHFPRLKSDPPFESQNILRLQMIWGSVGSAPTVNLASCWIENSKRNTDGRCGLRKKFNWTTGRCYVNSSKYLNFKYSLYLQICTVGWCCEPWNLQDRRYKELCCMLCKIMSVNQEIYHPLTLCHKGSISIVISCAEEANKLPCSSITNFKILVSGYIFRNRK